MQFKVWDLLRGTIIVKEAKDLPIILNQLSSKHKILRVKDKLDDLVIRQVFVNFVYENMAAEIQILV
jgi:hypothetical protein